MSSKLKYIGLQENIENCCNGHPVLFLVFYMNIQFLIELQESSSATDWRRAMPKGPPYAGSKLPLRKHSADKTSLNDLRGSEIEASTSMSSQVKAAIMENSPKIAEVSEVFLNFLCLSDPLNISNRNLRKSTIRLQNILDS